MPRANRRTEQQKNGELSLIIDEFSRAMWNANRNYVSREPHCNHESWIKFTPSMEAAWVKYVVFCRANS